MRIDPRIAHADDVWRGLFGCAKQTRRDLVVIAE
jgi:hypothetical protein